MRGIRIEEMPAAPRTPNLVVSGTLYDDIEGLLGGLRLKKHNPLTKDDADMIVAHLAANLHNPDFSHGVWQSGQRLERAIGALGFIIQHLKFSGRNAYLDVDWLENEDAKEAE